MENKTKQQVEQKQADQKPRQPEYTDKPWQNPQVDAEVNQKNDTGDCGCDTIPEDENKESRTGVLKDGQKCR